MLVLKGLCKTFQTQVVLEALDLTVKSGEFLAVVGPSGSGKSTLLRIIAGLEAPSSGDLLMRDQSILRLPPGKRNMAMVFQDYALYPHLTVFDNMAFCLKMKKMKPDVIQTQVRQVAERLRLTDYLTRKPSQLSGGQRQRVAIGRAFVREPQLFLFDEPLSNLDASLRTQLRLEMKRLHQTLNMTALYVTHSQEEAMALATRILVLNEGRAEQCDTPERVYFKPANLFVAKFMGLLPLNILAGMIDREKKCVTLQAGVSLALPALKHDVPTGTKVQLGIRPEDIQVMFDEEKSPLSLPVQEGLIEPMGADILLSMTSVVGELLLKIPSRAKQGRQVKRINLHQLIAHLFLADTGERIGGWDG